MVGCAVPDRAPFPSGPGVLVAALAICLTGCQAPDGSPQVQRVVVCAGADAQHPEGSHAGITLRQGGREVASTSIPVGSLAVLLAPVGPTAVLVDGRWLGAVDWEGGHPDPATDPEGAPDDAAVEAAAATDPDDVEGYVAITGPGCPPVSEAALL